MNSEIVFAMYRPHEGKESELEKLIAGHIVALREYELATDREEIVVRAENGTYIEIFEWRSGESARLAHQHPAIAKIWEGMGQCCDLATLSSLSEVNKQFPHFTPVDL